MKLQPGGTAQEESCPGHVFLWIEAGEGGDDDEDQDPHHQLHYRRALNGEIRIRSGVSTYRIGASDDAGSAGGAKDEVDEQEFDDPEFLPPPTIPAHAERMHHPVCRQPTDVDDPVYLPAGCLYHIPEGCHGTGFDSRKPHASQHEDGDSTGDQRCGKGR